MGGVIAEIKIIFCRTSPAQPKDGFLDLKRRRVRPGTHISIDEWRGYRGWVSVLRNFDHTH